MVSRRCVIGGRLWSVVKSPQPLVLPAMTMEKLILLHQALTRHIFFTEVILLCMNPSLSFIYLQNRTAGQQWPFNQKYLCTNIIHFIHIWQKLFTYSAQIKQILK